MPIFSWFAKKSSEEDYEQVLASLALSIQRRQTQLSEIRLRERRATLLFTFWAFSAWVAYVGLWWAGILGGRGRAYNGALWGVPVFLGPVVIVFTRRIVQLWYTRKGNAEEKTLKQLLVQQRNKIEEIKKKTNYYSTKNLLDRYDESVATGSKISTASGLQSRVQPGSVQSQNQPRPPPNEPIALRQAPMSPQTPVRGVPQGQPLSPTFVPLPLPRKQWYDKLADAILGDDTASIGPSPNTRYALICERCFSHNGLVKEEQWEDAQYLCPKCGYFNKSVRSRKAGLRSPTSPQSAASASSAPPSQSAVLPGFPSASAGLSVSQLISQGAPPPERTYADQTSTSPPSRDHESAKSSLSESTVFIDKSEADNQDSGAVGYDVGETEDRQGEHAEKMDVDS